MDECVCILLVDDDTNLRFASARLLREAGYKVIDAATGSEALRLASEEMPDLILLDIALPDMDGLQVLQRIRANTALAHSQVVMLSDFRAGTDDQARALESGADDYLPRPISNRQFLIRVQSVLRLKQAEDALREQTRKLGERVKELNCLYSISQLRETPGISLEEILLGTLDLIPPAWQYPELACARIILEDQEFKTGNFQETAWKQACELVAWGHPAGRVEVCYLEERPERDEGPFLQDERKLLNAIAERLGKIVERVRMETTLRETEERYRAVSELTSDLAYAFRVEADGTLVREWVTEAFSRLTGYGLDELSARGGWAALIHPEDVAAFQQHMESLLAGQQHTYEVRIITKDGQVHWLRDYGRPVWDKARGRIVRIYGAAKDITERKLAEQALQESEQRFRGVFEQSQDGITLTDEEGFVIEWNQAMERITGLRAERVLAKPIWDVQFQLGFGEQRTPEWYGQLKDLIGQALRSGQAPWLGQLVERRFHHPDGKYRFAQGVTYPIRTAKGFMLSSVLRDVTERVQAEKALADTTRLLETILDHTHMLVAYLDPDLNFVRVNRAYAEADQREPSFFEGKNHFDLYPSAENEEIFRHVVDTGQPYFVYARPFEYAEHPERGVSYWDWSLIPIKATEGTVMGLILTLADVTERVRAEEALRESEEKYRDLVENLNDVIYELDANGLVTYVSPAVESLLGYRVPEVVGQPFGRFVLLEDGQSAQDGWQGIQSGSAMAPNDYRAMTRSGTFRWLRTSGRPRVVDGQAVGVRGVLADVTEQVEAERQLKAALAEKETLLKEIHHRVKNNLQLISAMLALQARATSDARVTMAFEESQHRILSMAGIHEQLYRAKDLSQVDMAAYIRDLAEELRHSYGRPAITIQAQAAGVLLDIDRAIPCGLIVNELVTNALKHAFPIDGPQVGEIRVAMRRLPSREGEVELSVSDNGVGLRSELNLEQAKTLGLTMVSLLSRQLGSTLEVIRDHGTTFRIRFRA